uniref:Conotoxin Di8.1 n=1 Tax=Conus distans TaxID=72281 RepID=M9PN16_CONDI|nr:conotoxin Di8.1 [Conus distans]
MMLKMGAMFVLLLLCSFTFTNIKARRTFWKRDLYGDLAGRSSCSGTCYDSANCDGTCYCREDNCWCTGDLSCACQCA